MMGATVQSSANTNIWCISDSSFYLLHLQDAAGKCGSLILCRLVPSSLITCYCLTDSKTSITICVCVRRGGCPTECREDTHAAGSKDQCPCQRAQRDLHGNP